MFLLPEVPNVPSFTFDIDLEDAPFRFYFNWNNRDSSWYMSIHQIDDTPILQGKRVSLTSDLLLPRSDLSPAGVLVAFDTSGSDTPPGLDELGNRVVLVYTESTEL